MLTAFNSTKFKFWSFISMFFLVFVHAYNLNFSYLQSTTFPQEPLTFNAFLQYLLSNGLLRFRIPMLFIISGYLFALGDSKPYKQRIVGRVKTVLIPYFIWSAFSLLLTYSLELFPWSKQFVQASNMMWRDETRNTLHQFKWDEWLEYWIFNPPAYQLWFLRVLFFLNLLYWPIKWCVTHKWAKYIFFTIAVYFWIRDFNIFFIQGEGLLYFSLGVWMQKTNYNIDTPKKILNPSFWGIIFILTAVFKTLLAFSEHVPEYYNHILHFTHKLTVFSGLVFAWFASNKLVNWCMSKKYFVQLTSYSFIIYVLHAPLVVYLMYVAKAYFGQYPHYRLVTYFVESLVLIFGSVLIGFVLKKIMPKVYSFITGGRGI